MPSALELTATPGVEGGHRGEIRTLAKLPMHSHGDKMAIVHMHLRDVEDCSAATAREKHYDALREKHYDAREALRALRRERSTTTHVGAKRAAGFSAQRPSRSMTSIAGCARTTRDRS